MLDEPVTHHQQSLNPWANESRPMPASPALVKTFHLFLRQLRQCSSPPCPCSSFRQEVTAAMLAAPPFSASCGNVLQAACRTSYSASFGQEVAAAMLTALPLYTSCGNALRAACRTSSSPSSRQEVTAAMLAGSPSPPTVQCVAGSLPHRPCCLLQAGGHIHDAGCITFLHQLW